MAGRLYAIAVMVSGTLWLAGQGCQAPPRSPGEASGSAAAVAGSTPAPGFGQAFWKRWGDGRAELAGYDLVFPRYGYPRTGIAVAIFVTETFSNSLRVKADPGKHPESDQFPVMKLNLVRDFSTGIYDYNLMTSAFAALAPVDGRPAGTLTKVSFSSQEWCGNMYGQLLFDDGAARYTLHSYFDGEADQERRLPVPNGALDGDALLLWARGFLIPIVAPGESLRVDLLRSLERSRLLHQPVELQKAVLRVERGTRSMRVPAGSFEVRARTVSIEGGPLWTFYVEAAEPHRVVEWTSSRGERAQLRGSARLQYWKMNGPGGESELAKLGLKPRPPDTP